jgi:hypothetical protein
MKNVYLAMEFHGVLPVMVSSSVDKQLLLLVAETRQLKKQLSLLVLLTR